MHRYFPAILASAVALPLVLLPTPAHAALPKPDTVYAGDTDLGGKVRIVAETKGNLSLVKVTDECDQVTKWRNVEVQDSGKFRAVKKQSGFVVAKVVGEFETRELAKGTFSQVTCNGADETFEAASED